MRLPALVLALTLGAADPARGDLPDEVSGSINVASGYSYRGVSRHEFDGALYGNLEYGLGRGLYAGIWLGRYTPVWRRDPDTERDLYLGYSASFANGRELDVSLWRGMYASRAPRDYDWSEASGRYTWRDHWSLLVAVTDNLFGSDRRSVTAEVSYLYDRDRFSLVVALGRQIFDDEYYSDLAYLSARGALNVRNWHLFVDTCWSDLQNPEAPYSRNWLPSSWDVGIAYTF